jgi:hypothetical protein
MTAQMVEAPAPADWLVCLGEARPAEAGLVACPAVGRAVPVGVCAECRRLTWRTDDRVMADACSTQPRDEG